jgi:hypothetical protein
MNDAARREDDECLQTLLRFDLMIYMEIMHCDVEVEMQLLREEAEDVADQTLEPPVQRREPWRAAILRALAKFGECEGEQAAERIPAAPRAARTRQQAASEILAMASGNTAESSSDEDDDDDDDDDASDSADQVVVEMSMEDMEAIMGSDIDLLGGDESTDDESNDDDSDIQDSDDSEGSDAADQFDEAEPEDDDQDQEVEVEGDVDHDDFDGVVDDQDIVDSLRDASSESKKDQ